MASPFPGMDPFIEGYGLWGDFHDHLIEAIYLQLADSVPERYIVRTEQRNYIVLAGADEKKVYSFIPDVGVTTPRTPRRPAKESKKAESSGQYCPAQFLLSASKVARGWRAGFSTTAQNVYLIYDTTIYQIMSYVKT